MRKTFVLSVILFLGLLSNAQITTELLIKQLKVESNSSHYKDGKIITSSAGALGIAQFMPATWRWLQVTKRIPRDYDIMNRNHQLHAQQVFMVYLYNVNYGIKENKTALAAASYNAGVQRVKRLIKVHGKNWRSHLPLETQNYLHKLNI